MFIGMDFQFSKEQHFPAYCNLWIPLLYVQVYQLHIHVQYFYLQLHLWFRSTNISMKIFVSQNMMIP